jgi:hypothetical protein
MNKIMSVALVAVLIAVSGCERPPNNVVEKHKSTKTSDPVAELKRVMERYEPTSFDKERDLKASDFSFDVRKTDSLVSPYIGVIKYRYSAAGWVTAHFLYQDNRWVFRKYCVTEDESLCYDSPNEPRVSQWLRAVKTAYE